MILHHLQGSNLSLNFQCSPFKAKAFHLLCFKMQSLFFFFPFEATCPHLCLRLHLSVHLLTTWSFNILDCLYWQVQERNRKDLASTENELLSYLSSRVGQKHTSGMLAAMKSLLHLGHP